MLTNNQNIQGTKSAVKRRWKLFKTKHDLVWTLDQIDYSATLHVQSDDTANQSWEDVGAKWTSQLINNINILLSCTDKLLIEMALQMNKQVTELLNRSFSFNTNYQLTSKPHLHGVLYPYCPYLCACVCVLPVTLSSALHSHLMWNMECCVNPVYHHVENGVLCKSSLSLLSS